MKSRSKLLGTPNTLIFIIKMRRSRWASLLSIEHSNGLENRMEKASNWSRSIRTFSTKDWIADENKKYSVNLQFLSMPIISSSKIYLVLWLLFYLWILMFHLILDSNHCQDHLSQIIRYFEFFTKFFSDEFYLIYC